MLEQKGQSPKVTQKLYSWHEENPRDLPWKMDPDPYRIWVSEVILQQTRVAQGIPYYLRFIESFPGIKELSLAKEDTLMAVWKGLGYYSRARNMQMAARIILRDHGGKFPTDYDQIICLPGIGPYTAAAISSFSFGQPYPVIDGNVKRVIARLAGIEVSVDTKPGRQQLEEYLWGLFDRQSPARFNQAIMDFGALQCTPQNPECDRCPLSDHCRANREGTVTEIPLKKKRTERRKRNFHYFVITSGDKLALRKRQEKDIWQGLYEPLLVEIPHTEGPMNNQTQKEYIESWIGGHQVQDILPVITGKQLLSHQEIRAYFYHVRLKDEITGLKTTIELVNRQNLSNFALPKVVDWYLQENGIN